MSSELEKELEKYLEDSGHTKLVRDAICELTESGFVVTKIVDGKNELIKSGTQEWFDALELYYQNKK
jgi:hypothetical protein